jgi:hydroxyacylglutathione hydrolase
VLSGDSLFVGDVGRPDFGGPEGALAQYTSVQRLLELPDWVEVFPAHFEGACGKGMCGRPSSTIGFERRFNPVLQLSREDFVRQLAAVAARPLNMTAILHANRGACGYPWPVACDVGAVPTVALDDAPDWLIDHAATIVDVREPQEYASGHLPGAIPIPQADLAVSLSELPEGKPLLVVCASGVRSLRATAFLRAVGFDAFNLAGGTRGWQAAGHSIVVSTTAA